MANPAAAAAMRNISHQIKNRAWQLHTYGSIQDLIFTDSQKIPFINSPTDVLIKVHAASVNPIDILMVKGYGSTSFNCVRALESFTKHWTSLPLPDLPRLPGSISSHVEFPLVLGRDFAGTVEQIGHSVHDFKVGDEVFGVVGIQSPGTHSDFVVASSNLIKKKPENLSFPEAASIPYAGLTAWSAIRISGSYYFTGLDRKKILVLGGSGGVGTIAIQYLKSYGAYVVSTCSTDAVSLLSSINCDFVVDYKSEDFMYHLKSQAPFDCILDLTGLPKDESQPKPSNTLNPNYNSLLKPGIGQKITLSPPLIKNLDKYGLLGGLLMNANDLVWDNWKSFTNDSICTKWGFFVPSNEALQDFTDLITRRKVQPVIQEIFKFDSLPDAYKKLQDGHARGKIVIDFE